MDEVVDLDLEKEMKVWYRERVFRDFIRRKVIVVAVGFSNQQTIEEHSNDQVTEKDKM